MPGVILYMDAFGIRPALLDMAARLAATGYNVLLPDLYYRLEPTAPFEPATAFKDPAEMARLGPRFKSLTSALVMEDTAAYLEYLGSQTTVLAQKTGCVGYCMGGRFALAAAGTFPERIATAASFHGARLATDDPDSPHLLAPRMRARVYIGIAGIDDHFPPEERQRLESALESAHVSHTVEVYEGARHGFAVNDTPAYDKAASEKHWQRLGELFGGM